MNEWDKFDDREYEEYEYLTDEEKEEKELAKERYEELISYERLTGTMQ